MRSRRGCCIRSPTEALATAIAWQVQFRSSLSRPIGVCRGRGCGNQQPSHIISSSLHVVHAVHANDAQQQAAGAPIVASSPASALPSIEPLLRSSALTTKRASSRARMASGDGLRAICSRSGSYMRQPTASALGRVRSARPLHPLTNSSPGCHRIGRECSPGPRWHGRLACIRP